MSNTNDLHSRAMDLAEMAVVQRLRGNTEEAAELAREALQLETSAIEELSENIEPTFSILHRSAGYLALQSGEYRRAEQIAAEALAQEPPHEIAEELRDLIEQVHFRRHLDLRGIELGLDELQVSLSGGSVGFGLVTSDELVSRIGNVTRLIARIVERQRQEPFAEDGPRKKVRDEFPVLISVPRAASFAVTLRVGRPTGQLHLPIEIEGIVDEFLDLMEIVDTSDIRALEERIPDPAYLRNFLGIAKRLAPDGERVRQVGFTVERQVGARRVSVTKPATDILLPPAIYQQSEDKALGKDVEIRGVLRFADATGQDANVIKILMDSGRHRKVTVPEGMMSDVVRPMWDSKVLIKGLQRRGRIVLQDIELDE